MWKRGNHWLQVREGEGSSSGPKSNMTWPLRRLKKRPLVSKLTYKGGMKCALPLPYSTYAGLFNDLGEEWGHTNYLTFWCLNTSLTHVYTLIRTHLNINMCGTCIFLASFPGPRLYIPICAMCCTSRYFCACVVMNISYSTHMKLCFLTNAMNATIHCITYMYI